MFVATLLSVSLVGCSSHEGRYSPACIAYAGSIITLSNGKFVWEKFTDALAMDDDGNVVNPFPGYPMHGTYRIEGQTVFMEAVPGEKLANMYLEQHDDRQYLLTAKEAQEWRKTGKLTECALVLDQTADN